MKRTTLGMIAMVAALGVAGTTEAQMGTLPISAEVRGGFGFPMGDFGRENSGGSGANAGPGFGVNLGLGLTQMLGVYAGFDWFEFGQENSVVSDAKFTDSGLNAGAMVNLSGMAPMGPWVRGGVVWHKLDYSGSVAGVEGSIDSDRSLGFEVGGGLSFPLGMVISVTPGVRYVSYNPKYDGNGGDSNVSYLIADVGLRFGF